MKDGELHRLDLHHSRQDAKGPLFEVTDLTHRTRKSAGGEALHPYGRNKHPYNPVPRNAFNIDRKQYWIDRAKGVK